MNIENTNLDNLIQDAYKSGAAEVAVISTDDIAVDNDLADKCRKPQCENFGMSLSCPPYVSGPEALRKKLENISNAIFFRINVPLHILYSNEGLEYFQLLHETASSIELSAVRMGYTHAQAFAGGPCKKIFCDEHLECLALSENGKCRYPQSARPSMSGFGINVGMLVKAAGFNRRGDSQDTESTGAKMADIYGLVLLC